MPNRLIGRTTGTALVVALLIGCATKEPLVPLLHLRADSPETAREAVQALESAGVPTELAPVQELEKDEIPDWVNAEEGGWILLGRAEDRERAEKVLAAWFADLKRRAPSPTPEPEALDLGTRRALDEQEVAAIQSELARRRDLDQVVRKDRGRHKEMAQVDADNTAYLKSVAADVGWIDVERFGRAAADGAFLLVQHSGDLPLMMAALPEIEKDVRAGKADAQNYALLYDRTQLMRGGKQRYGSQVRENEAGELVIFRLEDPDNVDAFRKELGLTPLKDYLALFGREVRIER
ncbi:MAG: DUF6624 domain-containing protein [Planctomycetota bacterium]|jgi:hypothetical protein